MNSQNSVEFDLTPAAPNYKFDKHSLITVFEPNSVVVGDFNSKSRLSGCGYSDSRGREDNRGYTRR